MVNSQYKNMSFVTCFCFWWPGAGDRPAGLPAGRPPGPGASVPAGPRPDFKKALPGLGAVTN